MQKLHKVTNALVILGALNWGLIALFDYNLVETLLGSWPTLPYWVYVLIGVSAVVEMTKKFKK